MDWKRFFKPKTAQRQTPNTQTSQKPSENATPILNQITSATKGATDAFSGVSKNVNTSLRKLGTSNIQASIVAYGIGFSHGFGVATGLSMRSGWWNQIQSRLAVATTNMMMKFGLPRGLPFSQGALPLPAPSKSAKDKVTTDQISSESMKEMATKSADQVSKEKMKQLATKSVSQKSQGLAGSQPVKIDSAFEDKTLKGPAVDSASDNQTEKVVSNLPQDPSLKDEGGRPDEAAGRTQPDKEMLQKVRQQRQKIEELVEENEKLRQRLPVENMKTPSSNLQASSSDSNVQTFPKLEVQDKINGDSKPPGDADGTSPTPKEENDGNKEES